MLHFDFPICFGSFADNAGDDDDIDDASRVDVGQGVS